MIDIILDERCIFTFSAEEKCIGIWRHRDGRHEGPVEGPLGFINFAYKRQAEHFREMMDFMIEGMKEEKNG